MAYLKINFAWSILSPGCPKAGIRPIDERKIGCGSEGPPSLTTFYLDVIAEGSVKEVKRKNATPEEVYQA